MSFHKQEGEIWIGLDLGTTGVRAIAYDQKGNSYASAEAFYPLLTPQADWAVESPIQLYESVLKVLKETAALLRYKGKELSGIALSTVMHSFAAFDSDFEPLMDFATWADSRSAEIVKQIKADKNLSQSFYQNTGCPIHACYPLAKVLWLKQNLNDVFQRMRYAVSIKDYLFKNLTGEWKLDHSTASTSGMYNEHLMDWDTEILAYAGLKKEQLPPVVSTTYKAGLIKEVAELLGLSAGLPVVIGATDGVLVNVGIGAVRAGQLSATIGTSGALRMLTPKPMLDPQMRTWCYNLVDDVWVAGGAINNGGMILRWLRDKICHYSAHHLEHLNVEGYDLMTMKAAHIQAGAEGLIMLPFFTGERAPYWNSELKGMFFGLSLNHSRSHLIRAALEGICFSMNTVMMALREFGEIKDIRISGSFTRAELWIQILADILQEPLTLPSNSEGAAFGAAVLGFISNGVMKGISDTADLVKPKKIYTPNPDNFKTYGTLYQIFERLYWNLQNEFADICKFQLAISN